MNLLFLALDVNLATPRGDSTHVESLARELGNRGHLLQLVTATPPGSAPFLGRTVVHHARPAGPDSRLVQFCMRLARRHPFAAIYERRLSPKIAFATSRLCGRPFVVEVNGSEEEARLLRPVLSRPWEPLKKSLRGFMYRRAARVVAVSDLLARTVSERYGVPPDSIAVVPNGVDPNLFFPLDPLEARRRLGWGSGPWVVFVGNLVPWQGLDVLLEALPLLVGAHPSLRVAIVGDGVLGKSLAQLARRLGVADSVLFLGACPHESVGLYIGAADVCVAPFTRERNDRIGLSPLKLYEYLACGRPVVASDLPGVRDILRASGGGLLVPPDDPQALARAVSQLLENPTDSRAMGLSGRRRVLAEWTWEHTAERIERLLREVAVSARAVDTDDKLEERVTADRVKGVS